MPLVTEQVIGETDKILIIKFTSPAGKELVKTVKKIAGMSNEDLLKIWHFRMTMKYMEGAIKANRLKRTILDESNDSITLKFDKRVVQ